MTSYRSKSKSLSKGNGRDMTLLFHDRFFFSHTSCPFSILFHNRCDTVTQNVPGTDSYWRSAFYEFESSSLQQSHGYQRTPKLFHTGSMAEYHEYDLRCCLATYVLTLSNRSIEDATNKAISIMTDDTAFVDAVQMYKNVVTHYFAAKTEIWMALFMKPVFGVTGRSLENEFAKSR